MLPETPTKKPRCLFSVFVGHIPSQENQRNSLKNRCCDHRTVSCLKIRNTATKAQNSRECWSGIYAPQVELLCREAVKSNLCFVTRKFTDSSSRRHQQSRALEHVARRVRRDDTSGGSRVGRGPPSGSDPRQAANQQIILFLSVPQQTSTFDSMGVCDKSLGTAPLCVDTPSCFQTQDTQNFTPLFSSR